jgi:hypothetical protein
MWQLIKSAVTTSQRTVAVHDERKKNVTRIDTYVRMNYLLRDGLTVAPSTGIDDIAFTVNVQDIARGDHAKHVYRPP